MSSDKKVKKILGIKGMNDILPQDAYLWDYLETIVTDEIKNYGYERIRTPIVEETALFQRGLGTVTDIVEKEMYSFSDALNGDELTLRPECTAGVVRSVIEHSLVYNGPKRLWYMGPMFRHERPQRGRYRQFHQIGVEAIGFTGPDVDVEIILMTRRIWNSLGINKVRLEINSIGDKEERARHRADLIAYFEKNKDILDADAQRRLYSNPLRILDTKNPTMQDLVNQAPKLLDYLGEESLNHFNMVQALLKLHHVEFKVNPRLVRGMDYYNRTVFEWISDELGSQGTICGGGRYDPLFEMFGAQPTPACGFAMGVERLIELLKTIADIPKRPTAQVYIAHSGENTLTETSAIAEALRDKGISVLLHCQGTKGGGSFKSQLKRANDSNASYTILIGEQEVITRRATVKYMRGNRDEDNQTLVPFEKVPEYLLEKMIKETLELSGNLFQEEQQPKIIN